MTEDQQLLQAVGRALYGARWQCALAADLGVSDRTVRRWVAGEARAPLGVWNDLANTLRARHYLIDGTLQRVRAHAPRARRSRPAANNSS